MLLPSGLSAVYCRRIFGEARMKEGGFCVNVGKSVGSAYRSVFGKGGRITGFFSGALSCVSDASAGACARIDSFFGRIKGDGRLAKMEIERKEDFAKLGGEVFRLKGREIEGLVPGEKVKEIVAKLSLDEARISEIRDQMRSRQKKMQELVVYKHAMLHLKAADPKVRRAALRVLEKLQMKECMPEVVVLLEDKDAEVRIQAQGLIQKLTHHSCEPEESARSIGTGTHLSSDPEPAAQRPAGPRDDRTSSKEKITP